MRVRSSSESLSCTVTISETLRWRGPRGGWTIMWLIAWKWHLRSSFVNSYMKFLAKGPKSSTKDTEEEKSSPKKMVDRRKQFQNSRPSTKQNIFKGVYKGLTPAERNICNKMSEVINNAISFRKKRALVSSKAVGTIELEKTMLDSCDGKKVMKVPPQRKVTR